MSSIELFQNNEFHSTAEHVSTCTLRFAVRIACCVEMVFFSSSSRLSFLALERTDKLISFPIPFVSDYSRSFVIVVIVVVVF